MLVYMNKYNLNNRECLEQMLNTVSSFWRVQYSSFTFPADEELRRKWIIAMHRDKFTVMPHTQARSPHFKLDDINLVASDKV